MKETCGGMVFVAVGALLLACGCVQEKKTEDVFPARTDEAATSSSSTRLSTFTTASTTIATSTPSTTATLIIERSTSKTTSSSTTTLVSRPALTADIKLARDTFHSGDLISIDVMINSPGKVENIGVRIYGIYANGYRLNQSTSSNLIPGLNDVLFTYKAPPCNTCAGIAAGKYVIKAEIVYDGKVAAIAMKDVNLMQ